MNAKFITKVVSGALLFNGGYDTLYVDVETGEVVLEDSLSGNLLMSELSLSNPTYLPAEAVKDLITFNKSQGVILTCDKLTLLFSTDDAEEFRAVTYSTTDLTKPIAECLVDVTQNYDGVID